MQISKELRWCLHSSSFLQGLFWFRFHENAVSKLLQFPSVWILFQRLFESSAAIELEGLDLSENWRSRFSFC